MPAIEKPVRILALDVGSKRIGMAVSDELGMTAIGIETLQRRDRRADLNYLRRVIKKHGVREVVVGKPLHMTGESGDSSERAAKLADLVREKFGLPVHLWDERLTSWQAEQILKDAGKQREKGDVDQMAAVLILESFMASRRPPTMSREEKH